MIKELPPSIPFLLELIEKYESRLATANQYEYSVYVEIIQDITELKDRLIKSIET
jgi:undecaprenyl pyrophosphate synthase